MANSIRFFMDRLGYIQKTLEHLDSVLSGVCADSTVETWNFKPRVDPCLGLFISQQRGFKGGEKHAKWTEKDLRVAFKFDSGIVSTYKGKFNCLTLTYRAETRTLSRTEYRSFSQAAEKVRQAAGKHGRSANISSVLFSLWRGGSQYPGESGEENDQTRRRS